MRSQNNPIRNSEEAGSRGNPIGITDEAELESHQGLSHQELRDFYESSMGSQDNPIDLSHGAESPAPRRLPNNNGPQRERTPEGPAELSQPARYTATGAGRVGSNHGLEETSNGNEQYRSLSRTLSASSSNYGDSTRSSIPTGFVAPPPSDDWSTSASRSQSESWAPGHPENEMQLQAPAVPSQRFSRVHEALLMDSQQRQLLPPSPISTIPPVSPSDSNRELLSPTPLPPPTPRPRFSRVLLVDSQRELRSPTPLSPPTTCPRYGRVDDAPPSLPPLPPMNGGRRLASPSPISPLPPPNPYYGMHSRHPAMLVPLSPNTHYGMHLQPASLLRPLPPPNAHNEMHLPFLAPLPPTKRSQRNGLAIFGTTSTIQHPHQGLSALAPEPTGYSGFRELFRRPLWG